MEIEVNACIDITSICRKRFFKVLIGGNIGGILCLLNESRNSDNFSGRL